METSTPAGMALRAGEIADLPALCAVDEDAAGLYLQAGIEFDLPDDSDFVAAERGHWQRSLAQGTTIVAADEQGRPVGFAALSQLDQSPYLAQLSVRREHMRRGVGSTLLAAAIELAGRHGTVLWLTTYEHLAWNRPFYEKNGFVQIGERDCSAGLRAQLALERGWLPLPEKRIAMRRVLRARSTR